MANTRKWVLPVLGIFGVLIVEELRLAWTKMNWDMKHTCQVTDIMQLMDQYNSHRLETGEWPEAKQPYGVFFHLRVTEPTTEGRIDTFIDNSFSPTPTRLEFELKGDGHIHARIFEEK